MNQQELIEYINKELEKNPKYFAKISRCKEKYKEISDLLIYYTSWCNEDTKFNERFFCLTNGITSIPKCKECDHPVNFDRIKKRYRDFCSLKCSNSSSITKNKKEQVSLSRYGTRNPKQSDKVQEKYKQTCLDKYGTEHYSNTKEFKQKYKETCLNRYGTTTTAVLDEVIEKRNETNLKRYGDKNPTRTREIKEKTKETCLEKYGIEHYSKTEEFKQKQRNTCLEKYGVDNYKKIHFSDDTKRKLEDYNWLYEQHITKKRSILSISKELGIFDGTLTRIYNKHGIETHKHYISSGEMEITDFLSSVYNGEIQNNVYGLIKDDISNQEIDIYIPDLKIGIEYCGLFYHSDYYKKDKNYHLNKTENSMRNGIRLIQIFENEWLDNKDIVKEKLKNILNLNTSKRVYARKTNVVQINRDIKREFLNKHHIQGNGGGIITYGLYNNNELVSLMTFKKRSEGVYELNRFASSCNVVGGFSKLLSHFKKNHDWIEIISFADRRWSEGDVYFKNGFELVDTLKPDYKYVKGYNIFHKFNFRHSSMKWKLKKYNASLTEHENMLENGYNRIYDCGLLKFSMKNKNP